MSTVDRWFRWTTTADMAEPLLDAEVLDNPAWASLTGVHANLAETFGGAARYLPDVAPHAAVRDETDPRAWHDLRRLVGAGREVALAGVSAVPAGWDVVE